MANQEQLQRLRSNIKDWNEWRKQYPEIHPDLSDADLIDADLSRANLNFANLSHANLRRTSLRYANLTYADLHYATLILTYFNNANLSHADLSHADLNGANLTDADLTATILSDVSLISANLSRADLRYADFAHARIGLTIFGEVDLRPAKKLNTIEYMAPSTIGADTIMRSEGDIPEAFLRGAGLSDTFITYVRSLVGKPFDYYSCFISHSSKDKEFADRLYADLQREGVRCWYAPEDLEIGDKIRPRIEESIRLYDKLLIVLSENSISSTWVAYEVERAINKEPAGIPNVLYPIRLDDAVKYCNTDWANDIRTTRNIGDFSNWKSHDAYQKAFDRLLRALKSVPQKQ